MELELITCDNIDIAIGVQRKIFPLEDGTFALKKSVSKNKDKHLSSIKYWLVKEDNKIMGICGLYSYHLYKDDAWLGWFGVVEEERRKGYGSQILNRMMSMSQELGFKNFRLYTDDIENKKAIKLYEKMGMFREIYNNADDNCFKIGNTLIFSKCLVSEEISLWNNKNLYLSYYENNGKE